IHRSPLPPTDTNPNLPGTAGIAHVSPGGPMSVHIPRRVASVAAAAIAVAALAAVPLTHAGSAPSSTSQLGADLDRILANQALAGAQVGLEVRDATTGDVLYGHNAQERLLP